MSDKHVSMDVAQQAIDITELKGAQQLLAQQVKSSVDNVTSSLNNVQLEMRNVASKVSELAGLQHSHDSNSRAISEVKSSVSALGAKLETWFEDFETAQAHKWEKHEQDRDAWRAAHEADNRRTREKIILWTGMGFSFLLLGGAIVSGFLWVMNDRFSQQNAEAARTNAAMDSDRKRSEMAIAANRDRIEAIKDKQHEVELYLARGGATPRVPYNPQGEPK